MFVFDKRTADKLHKPRRKETISEMLRHGVRQLERCRHPRLLHVLHSVEETGDTLAFATEPVATSLGNALAALEDRAAETAPASTGADGTLSVTNGVETYNGARRNSTRDIKMPPPADYTFLDIEIKYGILQVFDIARQSPGRLERSIANAKRQMSNLGSHVAQRITRSICRTRELGHLALENKFSKC